MVNAWLIKPNDTNLNVRDNRLRRSKVKSKMNNCIQELRHMRMTNVGGRERMKLAEQFLAFFPMSVGIKEEMALSCWDHDLPRAMQLLNEIEEARHGDESMMRRVVFNKNFFLKLSDGSLAPHLEPVHPIKNPVSLVTFSITTCKRLDLFVKTMDSFLENFLDKNLISRWICVDDNSSEEDRRVMKERYPFFDFFFKGPEDKGHPRSMQLIVEHVSTPFLIHIEDDRQLIDKRHFVADMIDVLEHDPKIGQVAFNHNYMETIDEDIKGGVLKTTSNHVHFFEHEHCTTDAEKQVFASKHGECCTNVNYYPHFTLSPSMIKTSIFKDVQFKDEVRFEFAFAQRYSSLGYKTAFLPGFHIKHIGRLTSELQDMNKFNAYDLLDTRQFSDKIKWKSFVVNLDRRQDRMDKMNQIRERLPPFERVSAVDGALIQLTPHLKWLCRNNDFDMRTGVLGCAMSHLKLFAQLLNDPDVDGYIIMEDDIDVEENVVVKMRRVFSIVELRGGVDQNGLIFFAHVPKYGVQHKTQGLVTMTKPEADHFSVGGTGCYFISKAVAKAVFDYLDENGLDCPIDVILYRLLNQLKGSFVLPPFVNQGWNSDSDVQTFSSLSERQFQDVQSFDNTVFDSDGSVALFNHLVFKTRLHDHDDQDH